jgi:hypothetical protein
LGIVDWREEVEDWRGKIEARQARVEQAEAEGRKPTGRQGGKPSRAVKTTGEGREPGPRGHRLIIAQLFYPVKRPKN